MKRMTPIVADATVHIAQLVLGIQLRDMKRTDVGRLEIWLAKNRYAALADAVFRVMQDMLTRGRR